MNADPSCHGPSAPSAGASAPRSSEPASTPEATARLLVADDDPDVCRTLCSALQLYGYEVDAAHDGAMAWDALNTNTYDLVITDHTMPKLTGLELIRRVHAVRPDLPCILISGNMPIEETELISPHLPFRAVEKPFRLANLANIARSLMAAHPIKPVEARAAAQPIACLA